MRFHFWAAHGIAQGKSFLEVAFPFLNGSLTFWAKYRSREMRETNGEIFSWKEEERAVIHIHSSVQDILRSAWEQPNKRRNLERGEPGDSDVHGDSPEGVGAMSSLGSDMVILWKEVSSPFLISVLCSQYRGLEGGEVFYKNHGSFDCCWATVSRDVAAAVLQRAQGRHCDAELIWGCSPGDPKVFTCPIVLFQDGGIEPLEQGQLLSKWWGKKQLVESWTNILNTRAEQGVCVACGEESKLLPCLVWGLRQVWRTAKY